MEHAPQPIPNRYARTSSPPIRTDPKLPEQRAQTCKTQHHCIKGCDKPIMPGQQEIKIPGRRGKASYMHAFDGDCVATPQPGLRAPRGARGTRRGAARPQEPDTVD